MFTESIVVFSLVFHTDVLESETEQSSETNYEENRL